MPPAIAPHDPAESTRRMAAALLGMVRLAGEMVALGRPVDLAGLDDRVGQLCARALDLPQGRGRQMVPALQTLAAALESLHRALEEAA